ncbi:MAG TPA: hypothetical protein PK358_17790 [Spirochaetota bacterium]|nr:hypothetical protein [Spirochaetota bacterium]
MKKFLMLFLVTVFASAIGCKKAETKGKVMEYVKLGNAYSVKVLPVDEGDVYKDNLGVVNAPLNSTFITVGLEYKNITKESVKWYLSNRPVFISPENAEYKCDLVKSLMYSTMIKITTKNTGIGSDILNPGVSVLEGAVYVVPKEQWSKPGWRLRFEKYTDVLYK